MNTINLIDAHFQNSNLFAALPVFDAIHYLGHPDGKVQLYRAEREGQACKLLALTLIRREEKFLWEAAEDLLGRCTAEAAGRMQGVYTFDLLTFDIHREVNSFNYAEVGALIVNNSLKIRPGEQRLIKYSEAYGILQKLVVEPWGKVVLKTSVEVFNDKPLFLFSVIKRLFKLAQIPHDPLILLINDLSSEPLYDPNHKEQNEAIKKVIDAEASDAIEFLPEVYIQDKNGTRELLSGTIVK